MADQSNSFYVALIKDQSKNSFLPCYTVYFINCSNVAITQLMYHTGGYASSDDDLIEAKGQYTTLGTLNQQSSVVIGSEDEGSFDFDLWWQFDLLFADGKTQTLTFSLPKAYSSPGKKVSYREIPLLHIKGTLIEAHT